MRGRASKDPQHDAARQGGGQQVVAARRTRTRGQRPAEQPGGRRAAAAGAAQRHLRRHGRRAGLRRAGRRGAGDVADGEDVEARRDAGRSRRTHRQRPYVYTLRVVSMYTPHPEMLRQNTGVKCSSLESALPA